MSRVELNIEEIKEAIAAEGPKSKIYIGCDSDAFKRNGKWHARYVTVVVIHKNGRNGCQIFGGVDEEIDYTVHRNKPILRLMNEVYRSSGLYLELIEAIGDRHVEVHLDINPDEIHASNLVLSQAIGYIKGTCGLIPKIKPDAFAASCCADRLLRVKNYDINHVPRNW